MIGVFGGTFDPIHYGHLRSALEVKELFALDHVRLIPSANPPHRKSPLVSAQMRTEMLHLAVQNHPELVVDNRELKREGTSFMVDTLLSLRHDFPEDPLLLIIGFDAFNQLTSWHQWQKLFDHANIVALTRPGCQPGQLPEFFKSKLVSDKQELLNHRDGKLTFTSLTQLDISATKIRHYFANHYSPAFLLPDAVIAYIKQHQLYQTQS